MKKEETSIGKVDQRGAICIDKSGPVELWVTSGGDHIIYLHISKDIYLYNKRDYLEESQQLFTATARMVKKR